MSREVVLSWCAEKKKKATLRKRLGAERSAGGPPNQSPIRALTGKKVIIVGWSVFGCVGGWMEIAVNQTRAERGKRMFAFICVKINILYFTIRWHSYSLTSIPIDFPPSLLTLPLCSPTHTVIVCLLPTTLHYTTLPAGCTACLPASPRQ